MPASATLEPVSARHSRLPGASLVDGLTTGFSWAAAGMSMMVDMVRIPAIWKTLVCLGLLTAFLAGVHAAEIHMRGMKEFQVDPRTLEVREAPPWLDDNWTATIPDPLGGRSAGNLFETGLVSTVHQAYEQSPWIEQISAVRKSFPHHLSVRLKVRTPLAAIPWNNAFLLVDGHGVLLPKTFSKMPSFDFPLRVVEGVRTAPPEAGEVWESEALSTGLRVAAVLLAAKKPVFERITRIDVSLVDRGNRQGRTEVLLYAAEGGGPIEWGFASPGRAGLEIGSDDKMANLERLLVACPDMRAVKYSLVQFDEPVYVEVE